MIFRKTRNQSDDFQKYEETNQVMFRMTGIPDGGDGGRQLGPVFGIRIRRIRMLLGLPDPDPDPLVRGTDPVPAPDPSFFHKCVEIMPAK
jgi:hypothetical protein